MASIWSPFSLAHEQEELNVVHESVERGVVFRGSNLWVLIFAIIIASVGLNVNSTAVIIGAMLISPLMGPIIGMGYSVATYDFALLKKSGKNFGFAITASLITSTVYFLISPLGEAHSELLARTQPNIYDVIIALVGGLAGTLAIISRQQKGNVIPGAAIATALMPPLCTAGYGLASGHWLYFLGALYLFAINAVFIGLSTMITVRVLRLPVVQQATEERRRFADRTVTILAVLTLAPSLYLGYVLIERERFSQRAAEFVRKETAMEGDYLLKSEILPEKREIRLVYGGRPVSRQQIIGMTDRRLAYGLKEANVVVQQGFSIEQMEQDTDKPLSDLNRLRGELAAKQFRLDSITKRQSSARTLLAELKPIFPELKGLSLGEQLLFDDSARSYRLQVALVRTRNRKSTLGSLSRIRNFLKVRTRADTVVAVVVD